MSTLAAAVLAAASLLHAGDPVVTPGVDIFDVRSAANVDAAPEVLAAQEHSSAHESGGADVPQTQPIPSCRESPIAPCVPVEICEPEPGSNFGIVRMYTASEVYWVSARCDLSTSKQVEGPSLPAMVLRAFRRVPLPEPALSIQPPDGKTLVGLETIFSTKAQPFTKTLTLLGRKVTLKIEPSSFVWHHGDGTSRTTDWAGKAWDHDSPDIDGYLTHVYEHTGAVRPSVEVTWSAQFRVGGGAWRPVNGTVTRTGAPVPLQILEGQPVLNSY